MSVIPMIIKKTPNGERMMDIYSLILEERTIIINGTIEENLCGSVVAQLLYLDSLNNKPITIQITSHGGSILDGLSIIDTMKKIKSPINTICVGYCASMGAAILSQGDKRYISENSFVMIHQASSGFNRQNIQDLVVSLEFTKTLNDLLANMIAESCGKTKEDYLKDTIRDYWMNSKESLKYGIVDEIIKPTKKEIIKK